VRPEPSGTERAPDCAAAEEAEALWEDQAARYDGRYDVDGRPGRLVRARLREALALIGPGPGRILDVGMGGGRLCAALHADGWEVSGVDRSESMVALARRRIPELAASLQVARIETLPFPDESFDAVVALGVLEYAADAGGAVGELARVLRGRGRAVLSFPNFGGPYTTWRGGVWYPLVRAVKRFAPVGGPPPARLARRPDRRGFGRLVEAAGLLPERELLLRAGGGRTRPLLAAQILLVARKRV
jgi:SAM-dependent methyltransferase